MPNGKHLATLRRGAEAGHASHPEQLPHPAGQAVVEDMLEAAVPSLRKRQTNAVAGVRVETKCDLGYRLVIGEDP
jgi:hypothetical protein